MKKFFKKYKKALPFVVATAIVGSVAMACVMLGVVGAVV